MLVFRSPVWAPFIVFLVLACSRQPDTSPASTHTVSQSQELSNSVTHRAELYAKTAVRDPIGLRVVYPALTDVVRVKDSSFLFGSVASANTRLSIDGHPVRVWPNGAWLAWVPFPPDTLMRFRIDARTSQDSSILLYSVRRDRGSLPREVRAGGAWIDSVSLSPQGQVWLPRSEYLTLSTRAAEGADVRILLPDGRRVRLLPEKRAEEVLPATRAFDWDSSKLRTGEEVRYVGVVRGKSIGPDAGPILRGPTA